MFLSITFVLILSSIDVNLNLKNDNNIDDNTQKGEEITKDKEIINLPKKSSFWVRNFIHINNNWTLTNSTYDWCNGKGTQAEPYIIENVSINGQNSRNCILIENSNDYFIIRNCTIYNAWSTSWGAGIKLYNVENGMIIKNNASNNYFAGITLYGSSNYNIVVNNTCNDNSNTGIFVTSGNDNNIVGNTISKSDTGISLYGTAYRNNAINNSITYCNRGIMLRGTTGVENNIIAENYILFSKSYGIFLELGNDFNTFKENIITNNSCGIYLSDNSGYSGSDRNIFSNNFIAYNNYSVHIYTSDCENNKFYHNNFTLNKYNAIDNGVNNNWHNGYIGNYWYNYTGTDDDDDGCGSSPYAIRGSAGKQDIHPFCDDGYDRGILHVDDNGYYSWNWKFSSTFEWCSGYGIESDPYIIEDLTIGASNGNGIFIGNSSDVCFIIRNCSISDAMNGAYPTNIYGCIRLDNVNGGQIYSNNQTSTTGGSRVNAGLVLYNCENIIVINNTLEGNRYGIFMRYTNESLIFNNSANFNYDVGIFLQADCNFNNITCNNASFTMIYYGIAIYTNSENNNIVNNTANGNKLHGIFLDNNCDDNNITNNIANYNGNMDGTGSEAGICVERYCDYNTIANNTVNSNDITGIGISSGTGVGASNHNKILDNKVFNHSFGIFISQSDYNTVEGNTLVNNSRGTGNYGNGIRVSYYSGGVAEYNILKNNVIISARYGIVLIEADDTTIIGNIIQNSSVNGITILVNAYRTNITQNLIENNLRYGLYISGDGSATGGEAESWWTKVYNNTFIGNYHYDGYQIFDGAWDYGSSFTWFGIGNYWDDYYTRMGSGAIDVDDDGFGDIDYLVQNRGGYANKYDTNPIWWDAPVIVGISPESNNLFGADSPNYNIDLQRVNLTKVDLLYRLWNGTVLTAKTSFTLETGTIDQTVWGSVGNGTVTISFYANDTRGFVGFLNITVRKNIYLPIITITTPSFTVFGFTQPNITIYKSGPNLNKTWYSVWNGTDWSSNITYTGTWVNLNAAIWDSLGNGTYQIKFFINDSLSVENSHEIFIKRDIIAPGIRVINPSNFTIYGPKSPTITLQIVEGNLGIMCYSLDGGFTNHTFSDFSPILDQTAWTNVISNGTIEIIFYAKDIVDNLNSTQIILRVDLVIPDITIYNPTYDYRGGEISPGFNIKVNETNLFDVYYTLDNGITNTSIISLKNNIGSTIYEFIGRIDQSVWAALAKGDLNFTVYAVDAGGNIDIFTRPIVKEYEAVVDDDEKPDNVEEEGLPFWLQAIIAGAISGSVGLSIRIAYGQLKKRREGLRSSEKIDELTRLAKGGVFKKKYEVVYLNFLKDYNKIERDHFKIGVVQIGKSTTGNLLEEFYDMDENHLVRIKKEKLDVMLKKVKDKIEEAHKNNVNILVFPEMTTDLNYKKMYKEIADLAEKYKMYIITGGYHDVETEQNICVVLGPDGIKWSQEKHNPATINFGGKNFTEAIKIADPPHKIKIAETEYGRIAIAICRDFLDMDLRVELKNCEPPVDLVFNPAYSPVTSDFDAIHFDVRRSVFAYSCYTNVAEYGGAVVYSPEKDRTKRTLGPKEEGIIYKDVDLLKLRSERKRWEIERAKEKGFIQSTRE